MKSLEIKPFRISQTFFVPASKSYLQRYIALAALCNGISEIHHPNYCEDVNAALQCAEALGAKITALPDKIIIQGTGGRKQDKKIILHAGESGLAVRTFGLIAPALYNHVIIKGKGSVLKRDMSSLIQLLKNTHCEVTAVNNRLPIEVKGFAYFNTIEIDTVDTSQIITALLYISFLMDKSVQVKINKVVSKPYIAISIDVAKQFGLHIEHTLQYNRFFIPCPQNLIPVHTRVEGDWSNAAFFAVAAALSGKVELKNLNKHSLQGDKIILDILQKVGAKVYWKEDVCVIEKKELHSFNADLNDYPDLFPPLVVLATGIEGTSVMNGVSRLINKESNRAEVLLKEFSKLGADIKIENDKMVIKGKGYLNGGIIHSHQDHRIAMAASIAGCIAKDNIIIENADAVSKSYPAFYDHLVFTKNY
ncbi:MAG: 3-phosphoshikimate 1-carboxyvinyltransferase [Bacteroidia bacterium]|nr:3-phosphoshikimate 1-carboxyvinyltransferase [Bacteroidia bacterium]